MKTIIFDMNPLGSFEISSEAYRRYYLEKFNKKVYFYTRLKGKIYKRVDSSDELFQLKNRVITLKDLGDEVQEIPFDDSIRACPIDETYENDRILQKIIIELGDKASWKNSDLRLIEVEDDF